jgi:hypothetical protein
MKTFATYYKSIPLNKRINLKGVGAMLNPWLTQSECPFKIDTLLSLDISFARIIKSGQAFSNERIFFTIDWSNPIRRSFDILNNTCKNHFRRSHSMYPANSFDYLSLGTCNH